jgi:hypothetical protein
VIPYDIILSPRISPELLEMGSYEICVADLDDDGVVDTTDLLILLAAWDTPDGDVNGDGTTNVSDLLYLLGTWGCGDPTDPPVPESIQDCLKLYWGEQEKLEACIEAMIRAGTP